jgi:transcriptional regulator with XRE-family HTH domain
MLKPAFKSEIEQYVINRVREKRIAAGMTQASLAIEVGLSPGFIGHVESLKHRAKYNLNHLNDFSKLFKCDFQEFFPKSPL